MRLSILAVGQMRGTAEAALYDTYAGRIEPVGRNIGLAGIDLTEIKEQTGANDKLSAALKARPDAVSLALDENGAAWHSRKLADKIADWRDSGRRELVFVLGPADGLSPALLNHVDMSLSLGPMTWPHLLARAMLAEQLWRSVSILAGHPYHRD